MKLIRNGFHVEWNPMLQELADRDEPMNVEWVEIKRPHSKYAVCPLCKLQEHIFGDDGIRNKRCGNCGQRLNWE